MEPLWQIDYPAANDDRLELSFRDLIEIRVVKAFRDAGVYPTTIRRCFQLAAERTGDKRLRERDPVAGVSGRSYRVGSVVLDRDAVRPLAFVKAFATRATVGDRFAEFYDLHLAHGNVRLMSVYDDALRWPEADLRLLAQVSSVIAYSKSAAGFEELA